MHSILTVAKEAKRGGDGDGNALLPRRELRSVPRPRAFDTGGPHVYAERVAPTGRASGLPSLRQERVADVR